MKALRLAGAIFAGGGLALLAYIYIEFVPLVSGCSGRDTLCEIWRGMMQDMGLYGFLSSLVGAILGGIGLYKFKNIVFLGIAALSVVLAIWLGTFAF